LPYIRQITQFGAITLDYRSPIGLIAYGIRGDRREILARSIKGWRDLSAKALTDSKAAPAK